MSRKLRTGNAVYLKMEGAWAKGANETKKGTQRSYSKLAVHLGTRERKSGRRLGQGPNKTEGKT